MTTGQMADVCRHQDIGGVCKYSEYINKPLVFSLLPEEKADELKDS